ncbi:sugar isomerase (SIS) [Pediococcus acidilactici NGRI 0510Q]|uniref:SIS domain-containing protein n=1 Tax=Pediococcus acidilactici TaxID=1254 RepID=A0AAW8YJR5_PEDAC|nr:SIS domain-containing protein [Pediococcus acidilactici]KRN90472.1 sugar isomerase (sis) [Pediococcus acidilactici]MDV2621801.1 SIS domain-containing protein [Pediococcus acidilactici]QQC13959.1 SIS domain-containing protein [Pediococcus acidilactici]GAC45686.1 sugar isomerase (SIS) [Pediococcus acidilactici NGRI 0510Q]
MYQYINKVKNILDEVESSEKENINQAIELIVQANENKNSIYSFGASHAGILSEEMFYRAGGMITINAIFGREVMLDRKPITFTSKMERLEGYGTTLANTVNFKPDDVLILHSVSGRNPIIIDLALAAKQKGVQIIGLTNIKYSKSVTSRHSSGKRLFEVSDVVIDNHGDIGDAACQLKGAPQKVGPTSTVIGASILNTIIVEASQQLVNDGKGDAPVFYSANLDGGDDKNRELFNEYQDMIHYQY